MSDVADLLTELTARGVILVMAGDRLNIDAPVGAITADLRQALAGHKAAILARLRGFVPGDLREDPRPDLTDDSALWSQLLARAWEFDGADPDGCFGALLGIRCCGARLAADKGWVRISPGEIGVEYPALRDKWLVPHGETIRWLLAELASPSTVPLNREHLA
jgi:hypothetical protein